MANILLKERTEPRSLRLLVTQEETARNYRTSESKRTDEERLRLLLEITNILPWEADAESGRFTYVGEQAVRMLGYPAERWCEPGFWASHVHQDDLMRAAAERLNCSRGQDSYELKYRMLAADGRTVWLQDIINVIRLGGRPVTLRGFLIDITERKRMEEALVTLSGRLINAQEEERKRIARELHDDLNQRMALLSIELEQLSQRAQKPRSLRPLVHSLQTKAQEISAEIHRLSYRLHPSKLDHLGLAAAVESLSDELTRGRKLKVEFRQTGLPRDVPKDVSLCLFRIAQESLRNCVKHSGARRVRVSLEGAGGRVHLSVSDDGRGFDTESGALERGLGFTSMRERLRLVGGKLRIYSQPSQGTRLEISVPLAAEVERDQGANSLLTA
jgi:PAS domain S-box-containing protein